jgi:hypothetical protein
VRPSPPRLLCADLYAATLEAILQEIVYDLGCRNDQQGRNITNMFCCTSMMY